MSLADELKNYIDARGFVSINGLNEYTVSLKHKNSDGIMVSYKISNGERRLRQIEESGLIERVPKERTKPVQGYKPVQLPKGEVENLTKVHIQSKQPQLFAIQPKRLSHYDV